jgi:uncharacterized surface protein with fasciclin (FAS1) repeats
MTIGRAKFLRGTACLVLAGASLPVAQVAAAQTATAQTADRDVLGVLASRGSFDRFLRLCQRAAVTDDLRTPGPFTVFAPTDAAFNRIPASLIEDLVGEGQGTPDMVRLRALLTYHVATGAHRSTSWTSTQELQTLNGALLRVDVPQGEPIRVLNPKNPTLSTGGFGGGSGLTTNRIAAVETADIVASNGVVHVIDNVLLP